MASTIRCDIVSAEEEIFHGDVQMVVASGEMGELGITPRHAPLITRLPELRVVMEHVTTRDGVEFVRAGSPNLGATLTVHHLILNRNHLLVGGLPVFPHSKSWGYGPSGIIGAVLVVLLILLLLGKI